MQTTYSTLGDLWTTPRLTGLAANRAGLVVATTGTLDEDSAAFRSAVHLLRDPSRPGATMPQPLTEPASKASVLAVDEDGTVYLSQDKPVDGAEGKTLEGVWALPERGEPQLVLSRAGGIDELFPRGQRLVFTAGLLGERTEEEHARLLEERKKTQAGAILHDSFPTRYWDHELGPDAPALFVLDRDQQDAAPRRISLPEGRVVDVVVDAEGRQAGVCLETLRRGIHQRHAVWLVDLDGTEEPRLLAASAPAPGHEVTDLADEAESLSYSPLGFSPDGSKLLLGTARPWLPGQSLLLTTDVLDLATGERTPVAPDFFDWVSGLVWLTDTRLAFVSDDHGRASVWVTDVGEADAHRLTEEDAAYSCLQPVPGGLVALRDSVTSSAEPVFLALSRTGPVPVAQAEPLASPTPVLRGQGRLTEVETTAQDGTALRAWLALPESDGPFPLLTFVHGGPWGSWNSWTYRWNPWPFVAEGYAVLLPDPAISTGYGQAMHDRGGDQLGGAPAEDILALIAAAEQREEVDAEHEALLGGSYGGYMANWMAGHTGTKFRAIVSHASLWDQRMKVRTNDNGSWHEWLYEHPEGTGDQYNPCDFVDQIQVPMLVIHGDKDYRVPISQGMALWADLRRADPELEHRFLYFPDEGHWVQKPANSRIWYQTVLAFLAHHLRGEAFDPPELLG